MIIFKNLSPSLHSQNDRAWRDNVKRDIFAIFSLSISRNKTCCVLYCEGWWGVARYG